MIGVNDFFLRYYLSYHLTPNAFLILFWVVWHYKKMGGVRFPKNSLKKKGGGVAQGGGKEELIWKNKSMSSPKDNFVNGLTVKIHPRPFWLVGYEGVVYGKVDAHMVCHPFHL